MFRNAWLAIPIVAVLASVGSAPLRGAQTATDPVATTDPSAPRPRLALVLSGGGARGAAHIGVLQVLEELQIPVDMVIGTSMGSIVGGLYAAGMAPDEIERTLNAVDWNDVFTDKPTRRNRSFRRRQDDIEFLVRPKLRLDKGHIRPPLGLIQGQKLDTFLKLIEVELGVPQDFDAFFIPFRAVAADLATGEVVVLSEGSLGNAMRASMSVPGFFPPVEIEERLLIDGGVSANLPVGVAQLLGAERVLAVDISTPLAGREVDSVIGVFGQLTGFLTKGNVAVDLGRLGADDLLIRPDLTGIGAKEFQQAAGAVAIGRSATEAEASRLTSWSVSDAAWAEHVGRRREAASRGPRIVGDVVLTNSGPLADELVLARLDLGPGDELDVERLRQELVDLYGLDYFEPIDFDLRKRPDGRWDVLIDVQPRRTGLELMQFGINLENDFSGGTRFDVAARYQVLAINRRGGEWRNDVSLGDLTSVGTEVYQPIDRRMRYFGAVGVGYDRNTIQLRSGGQSLAEAEGTVYGGRLDLGRTLGSWGELRLGPYRAHGSAEITVGTPGFGRVESDEGGVRAAVAVDTLDSAVWPRVGGSGAIEYRELLEGLGADEAGSIWEARYRHALTRGQWTFSPGIEGGRAHFGTGTIEQPFSLGGFLRLSGLPPDDRWGERYALGRLFVYRELTRRTLRILRPGLYLGASIEAGNTYAPGEPMTWDSLTPAGSLLVGADTVVGPIYLGYGLAEGGVDRVFLVLGKQRR